MIYVSHRLAEVLELATRIVVIKDGTGRSRPPAAGRAPTQDEIDPAHGGPTGSRTSIPAATARDEAASAHGNRAHPAEGEFQNVSFDPARGGGRRAVRTRGHRAKRVAGASSAPACGAGEVALPEVGENVRTPAESPSSRARAAHRGQKRSGLVASDADPRQLVAGDAASTAEGPASSTRHATVGARRRDGRPTRNPARGTSTLDHRGQPQAEEPAEGRPQPSGCSRSPRVLILDEPTRGDMATRVELYQLIDGLARAGLGVLLISSDLTEVLGMTDRVLVMRQGRVVADLRTDATRTEDEILGYSVESRHEPGQHRSPARRRPPVAAGARRAASGRDLTGQRRVRHWPPPRCCCGSGVTTSDTFLTQTNLTNLLKQIVTTGLLSRRDARGDPHRRHRPLGRVGRRL